MIRVTIGMGVGAVLSQEDRLLIQNSSRLDVLNHGKLGTILHGPLKFEPTKLTAIITFSGTLRLFKISEQNFF